MIPNLSLTIAVLALGVPVLILFMLLPAILEFKKSKDREPRIIVDNISEEQIHKMRNEFITNIESGQKFDIAVIQPLVKIIAFLPNLEA